MKTASREGTGAPDGPDRPGRRLVEFVDAQQAKGLYTFDRRRVASEIGLSGPLLKKAAARLKASGRLAIPRRGFYVIVPIEYRVAGSPPPTWFIDALMRHLGRPFYVGVLSAAAIHGAAHQQPQEFQVVTDVPQRPARAGRARIRFLMKAGLASTATVDVKTNTGTMRVSTPEATAVDLVRYPHAAGGLDNVATVLTELADRLDASRLVSAAEADGEAAHVQRLGYLLELVGAAQCARRLAVWIDRRDPRRVLLRPGRPSKGAELDARWRVVVNETVEPDL